MNTSKTNSIKVSLIGDGGVGKTTFIKKVRTGDFETKYIATLGTDVNQVRLDSLPNICFNVWDCAGQEKFSGLGDGYFIGSDACIAMCSLTSKLSFTNLRGWIMMYERMTSGPVIICATKVDIFHEQRVSDVDLLSLGYPVVKISSKTEHNLTEPFQKICELLQ